jgi:predicted AlkP superfamily pyrophosphatase or phosphodiesterase
MIRLGVAARSACCLLAVLAASHASATPKVVLISLDGATPRLVEQFIRDGVLARGEGLALLRERGVFAERNVAITPTLTAPSHIAIATGSSAARNDIDANTFHLLVSPFGSTVSGFAAPIGGYSIDGPAESLALTANPIWRALRAAGKSVAAATFPGADGADIRVPGLANSPIVQPAHLRTVDFTVPFGEFGGIGAQGFTLATADFGPAPATTIAQLAAAGRPSFGPVLQKATPLDRFTVQGKTYTIQVAALDTTDDGRANYDTLVFFDDAGISKGPFQLPSTGPAFVKASDRRSSPFFLEGTARKAGLAFYVSTLAPDLSTVRIARYAADDIPPNTVQSAVDDINANVGFWADQADFRIPEKLSPGFASFPDEDLEAIYEDQVVTFVDYQTRVALRAMEQNPNADLVMVYIEQPDGSEHQFLLVDPRQPTNPLDPSSIGAKQDPAKVARYRRYVQVAYQAANRAVQRIIEAVGVDHDRRPRADVIVVSDHGFDPFHTAVNATALLQSAGIPSSQVRAVTSGPAVNFYINLAGRGPGGTLTPDQFLALQAQLIDLCRGLNDRNPNYTSGAASVPVFDKVFARPNPPIGDPSFGRTTSDVIGQDAGDVFAILSTGYNFDGTQSPVVQRLGDAPAATPVLSLPNFYGAHGYDPAIEHMSAIFYAAGPHIRHGGRVESVRNIDVAPTIARLLGVAPDATVEGAALERVLRRSGEDE